ncbi:tetraacyldisaccharide 4'-kinase [Cryomorpha ignava]|uniref:Tetraacyldisaccharide 4'-kinase n=1 Tax=Cryomorpha ignava TaxID=101383 RepID=A0A7K3WPT0_9FLAO|nr:tetraacyldisaccharide 4'-kinase [Cryomorpha ignava]NEN23498.1 tetraacyldisaccharide 4'-kinase [Cryomorpha ignava]
MQKIRTLLLPFSFVYGWILWLRNALYNRGILKSVSPSIKTIAIGNISLGGTGKTPHIEYILTLLAHKNLAVLSRGYGRKSNGTLNVNAESSTLEAGDEPLQIARKFPNAKVVVDGNRLRGIAYIQKHYPETELILLDDALQHRKLKAGLNILLTTIDQPFTKDYYLPSGNLRDHKIRAKDADIIVVTKCPKNLHITQVEYLKSKLSKYSKKVIFDHINYKNISALTDGGVKSIKDYSKVFLITGIAKPDFFRKKAIAQFNVVKHFDFRDHYQFKEADVERFRNFIGSFAPGEIAALTTEKDAMRLLDFNKTSNQSQMPLFYWEIGIDFGDFKMDFDNLIIDYAERT